MGQRNKCVGYGLFSGRGVRSREVEAQKAPAKSTKGGEKYVIKFYTKLGDNPAVCHEQMTPAQFVALVEQRQQAKTGITTAISGLGGTPVEDIAAADPLRATAGAVVVEGLRASEASAFATVKINGNPSDNVPIRKVAIGDDADMSSAAGIVDGISGTTLVANLTFDNGSKNNDSVSNAVGDGTQTSTQINAKLATRKPTFSLASLINTLEDVAIDEEVRYIVLFDQADNSALGRVKVFEVDSETHLESAYAAAMSASNGGEFEVDTTPASTAEKLAGE